MTPRLLLLAALVFVILSWVGVRWLMSAERDEPEGQVEQVSPSQSPAPLTQKAPPPTTPAPASPGAAPEVPSGPAQPAAPPRVSPDNPTSEQRVFLERLEALVPVATRRIQQCVDDARVPPLRPPEVRIRLGAEAARESGEVLCRARLLENGAADVYVRACIEDVVQELECPEPTVGARGAALESALNLRAAQGLR